ncbi:MAG: DUF4333 domain-containing protein [Solirubrobacteraceae bacterium]|nr:DUF4333 domain-containing protein [Solirubrobacteraceae bacterium]
MIAKKRFATVLLSVLALTTASCSEKKMLSEKELETQSQTALTKAVGAKAPPVDCPDEIEAKVGSSARCRMTIDGKPFGVSVKVTKVEGLNATFDVKVDEKPLDTTGAAAQPADHPTTLSPAGFMALREFVTLSRKKLKTSTLRSRCEALGDDAADEQVARIQAICASIADITGATGRLKRCSTAGGGQSKVLGCLADQLDQISAFSRDALQASADLAKSAGLAAGACRAYLLDPAERRTLRRFGAAAERSADLFRSPSPTTAQLGDAVNRLEIASLRFARSTTSSTITELRQASACQP